MKKLITLAVLFVFAVVVYAQDTGRITLDIPYGEIDGEVVEKVIFVGPVEAACQGVVPMTCLQVKESADGEWENFFGTIQNFAFVPGYTYELRVLQANLTDIPADVSSVVTQLVEIVAKEWTLEVDQNLLGILWVLETLNGETALESPVVSLTFSLDGRIHGYAGCNTYFSTYTLDSGALTFGPAGSTMMACAEGMDQELAFLTALDNVTSYQVEAGTLSLYNAEGNIILTFSAEALG